jgi:hypothetical protein
VLNAVAVIVTDAVFVFVTPLAVVVDVDVVVDVLVQLARRLLYGTIRPYAGHRETNLLRKEAQSDLAA